MILEPDEPNSEWELPGCLKDMDRALSALLPRRKVGSNGTYYRTAFRVGNVTIRQMDVILNLNEGCVRTQPCFVVEPAYFHPDKYFLVAGNYGFYVVPDADELARIVALIKDAKKGTP